MKPGVILLWTVMFVLGRGKVYARPGLFSRPESRHHF